MRCTAQRRTWLTRTLEPKGPARRDQWFVVTDGLWLRALIQRRPPAAANRKGTPMTNEQTARAFSGHRFEEIYDRLAAHATWVLVGEPA